MRPLPFKDVHLDWLPNEPSNNGLCAMLEMDDGQKGLKVYPCDSSFTEGHCFACTSDVNPEFGLYIWTENQPTSLPSAFPSKTVSPSNSVSPSTSPSQEPTSYSPTASPEPSFTSVPTDTFTPVPTDTPSESLAPSFTPTYTRNVGTCVENTCLASVSECSCFFLFSHL